MYILLVSPEYYRNRELIVHGDYDRPLEAVMVRDAIRDLAELGQKQAREEKHFRELASVRLIRRWRPPFSCMRVLGVWGLPF